MGGPAELSKRILGIAKRIRRIETDWREPIRLGEPVYYADELAEIAADLESIAGKIQSKSE